MFASRSPGMGGDRGRFLITNSLTDFKIPPAPGGFFKLIWCSSRSEKAKYTVGTGARAFSKKFWVFFFLKGIGSYGGTFPSNGSIGFGPYLGLLGDFGHFKI